MITSEIQVPSTGPPTTAAVAQTTAAAQHAFSFHDLLHIMNPLQYLPVVGTIYRAVTGDVIPEAVRDVGSLLVSGLMGGPIGVATYIATTIAEKVTGIDPEKIVAAQFNTATPAKAMPAETPAAPTAPASAIPTQVAWTPQQLAAYGVRSDGPGNLKLGDVGGADVLNSLELIRLGHAAAAYATNQAMPTTATPLGS
jgi:hypothetical protein